MKKSNKTPDFPSWKELNTYKALEIQEQIKTLANTYQWWYKNPIVNFHEDDDLSIKWQHNNKQVEILIKREKGRQVITCLSSWGLNLQSQCEVSLDSNEELETTWRWLNKESIY
jgi:inactivated superfamily I helicase